MITNLTSAIVFLLVGISVLLIGMRLMSSGLRKSVGSNLKRFFQKTQNNPLVGLLIGTCVTVLIQSSDATNAMVIGFINAGAMSLFQGLSTMLGAYIGTTMTGILASFSSLSISLYLLLFAVIGTVMMFFKNKLVKSLGELLSGLGLLFFGLAVMKAAFGFETIANFCQSMFAAINFGPLLFLIGVVLAALVQSSSAVTSIVIAMVGAQAIALPTGLFIVLGATLGTVTNTLLISIGGSVNGKRAAWIAFTLRALTSLVMLLFLSIFSSAIAKGMHVFAIQGSDELPIAMFTVFYNLVFMPACIPLLKPFIKLFSKIIKDKEADELSKTVHFIDDRMINQPSVGVMQVKKEIINMYELAYINYINGFKRVVEKDSSKDKDIIELEDKVDYLNKRITDFLIGLTATANEEQEHLIGSYFHVINDIERIGDHAYNFYEMGEEMKKENLSFSEIANEELNEFNNVLLEMFDLTKITFEADLVQNLDKIHSLENVTDELKTKFYYNHYERIKNKQCTSELTPFISSLIVELERIADHLTNIAYSISNPTGDE